MLPELNEEEARRLAAGAYGKTLLLLVASHTTVFGFKSRKKDGARIRSGSVFFVRTPKKLLAVTAKHVYEGYLSAKQDCSETVCQFGNFTFVPEDRIISTGGRVDIATFEMLDHEVEKIGKKPIEYWPPMIPSEDKGILFAGFPAVETIQLGTREYSFGMCVGSGVARTVTDHQFTTVIEHDQLVDTLGLGRLPSPNLDIGGMSGGPVLTLVETPFMVTWRLGGVIVQGWPSADMIVAHRADTIDENGKVHEFSIIF